MVLTIGGLALLDTLSPATIGVTAYLLLTVHHGVGRLLFTYLATVAGFYFCLGVGLLLGLDAALRSWGEHLDSRPAFWVQATVGAALFVGSWFVPTKRRVGTGPRHPHALTTPAMVGLGVTTGVLEAAMALPYLGAIGILASSDLGVNQWAPVLAGYNAVMVLPPVLMYAGWRATGERLRPRFERWQERITAGSREAMAWIMGIAGFLVLRDAIFRLGGFDVLLGVA